MKVRENFTTQFSLTEDAPKASEINPMLRGNNSLNISVLKCSEMDEYVGICI